VFAAVSVMYILFRGKLDNDWIHFIRFRYAVCNSSRYYNWLEHCNQVGVQLGNWHCIQKKELVSCVGTHCSLRASTRLL
jgi:hypothetical protein